MEILQTKPQNKTSKQIIKRGSTMLTDTNKINSFARNFVLILFVVISGLALYEKSSCGPKDEEMIPKSAIVEKDFHPKCPELQSKEKDNQGKKDILDDGYSEDVSKTAPLVLRKATAVAYGYQGTFPMYVWTGETVSDEIMNTGQVWCPPPVLDGVKRCVAKHGKDCIFFDVGANIGSCTIPAALMGAKVYAFEAMKENAMLVELNLIVNNIADRVTLFPVAVGEKPGQSIIYRRKQNAGHNMIGDFEHGYRDLFLKDMVTINKIDDLVAPMTVHLMKMDIEGYEQKALEGATNLLTKGNVQQIMFEFAPILLSKTFSQPEKSKEMLDFMEKIGYKLYENYDTATGQVKDPMDEARKTLLSQKNPQNMFITYDLYAIPAKA